MTFDDDTINRCLSKLFRVGLRRNGKKQIDVIHVHMRRKIILFISFSVGRTIAISSFKINIGYYVTSILFVTRRKSVHWDRVNASKRNFVDRCDFHSSPLHPHVCPRCGVLTYKHMTRGVSKWERCTPLNRMIQWIDAHS